MAGSFAFKTSEALVYTSGIIAILVPYNAWALLLIAFPFYATYDAEQDQSGFTFCIRWG